MQTHSVPYGKDSLTFTLPEEVECQIIEPATTPAAEDPLAVVESALTSPLGERSLDDFRGVKSAAVAVSDKTRPVPHQHLLPPLLHRLGELGLSPDDIDIYIATGLHPRMEQDEFTSILPNEVLERYHVICHDPDDKDGLVHLGETARGTPVWINRGYAEADLRLVVGNIEPHQFQGFSGGFKGAAIGLAGRDTINANHSMMGDPNTRMGSFDGNPARQDIEEIGRIIDVHFALNALVNHEKRIVRALAGDPSAVMEAGVPLSLSLACVSITSPFDMAIASAGGHPKDLNLYQSQKALSHASVVVREGGTIVLVAACSQGSGSLAYETWMEGMHSHEEVIERFHREAFRVGPHKALQIARDALRVQVILKSEMDPDFVRKLLLTPVADIQETIDSALARLPKPVRVGILPNALSTIPIIETSS